MHKSNFEHLAELGLANLSDHGIELVNNGTTLLVDENDVHVVEDNGASTSTDSQSEVNRLNIRLISDREKQIRVC